MFVNRRAFARAAAACLCWLALPVFGAAQTFVVLHHFRSLPPAAPTGGVIRDGAGNLLGTTASGGNGGYGTVFKLDPAGFLSTVHAFTGGSDGTAPVGSLIDDGEGNLYGTTYSVATPSRSQSRGPRLRARTP
jgi:uncharacterized repeat protein (TIGR03803 family)